MTMFQNLARSLPAHGKLKIECEACAHRAEWTRGALWSSSAA